MRTIRKDKAAAVFVVALLIVLYGYSLTRTLARPPSEFMSREIPLFETQYGFSKTANSHLQAMAFDDGQSGIILTVDAEKTRFIEVDIKGRILENRLIELDLSQASLIKISSLSRERVEIIYRTDALYRAEISLKNAGIQRDIISSDSLYFDSFKKTIVEGKRSGLFIHKPEFDESLKIFEAKVLDYKLGGNKDGSYILIIHGLTFNTVRLELLFCPEDKRECISVLSKDVSSRYYSDLQDLRIDEGQLWALFKYEDGRHRTNHLTVLKIDLLKKEKVFEQSVEVPLYHSKYTLIEAIGEDPAFIYQSDTMSAVNLALGILKRNGNFKSYPLTKTKSMSKLGGSFKLGNQRALVFSDIGYENRTLYFASDQAELIEESSRFRTIPFWYPLITSILMYFVSLVTGILYLLALLPLPVIYLFLSDHILFRKMKSPAWIQNSTTALVHTCIKILISHNILYSSFHLSYKPFLIGEPAAMLLSLFISSILSFLLSSKKRGIDFYIAFALYDYLFYTGLITMYMTSSILLGKL